ncbi:MAG TPA: hypothetical protein VM513_27285 [Kofleriaceae bacterium]|nr:hypothetical protein [Kofleriaceae bacterium]
MQAFDAGNVIEPSVERHDARDVVVLHDRDVERVSRGQPDAAMQDLLGALNVTGRDCKDLVDDAEQSIERGLDRVLPLDRHIPMKNLLQYLGVGDETLTIRDRALDQALRVDLVRMRSSDEVHREVRIDEDHAGRSP